MYGSTKAVTCVTTDESCIGEAGWRIYLLEPLQCYNPHGHWGALRSDPLHYPLQPVTSRYKVANDKLANWSGGVLDKVGDKGGLGGVYPPLEP